jgi:hypothetical protein
MIVVVATLGRNGLNSTGESPLSVPSSFVGKDNHEVLAAHLREVAWV